MSDKPLLSTKDEEKLLSNDWVRVGPDDWKRKNSFIDMSDGSTSMCTEDALKIQAFLDDW